MPDPQPAPQGTPGTTQPATTQPAGATTATTTTTPAGTAQTGQQPATTKLAGKYESRDALNAGIRELDPTVTPEVLATMPDTHAEVLYRTAQRAFTKERQAATGTQGNANPFAVLTQPAKVTVTADENPRQIFEKAGINFDAAMTSGGLSEADKKALAATYNWDNATISLLASAGRSHFQAEKAQKEAEVQARNAQLETQVYPMFGGEQKMKSLLEQARETLSPDELKFYSAQFASPDVGTVKAASSAFLALMATKTGQPLGTSVTATPMGAVANKPLTLEERRQAISKFSKGMISQAELAAALKDVPAAPKKG